MARIRISFTLFLALLAMGCETEDSELRVFQDPFSGEKRQMEVHDVAKWQIVIPTENPAWLLMVVENERPLVSYSGGPIPFVFVHDDDNPSVPVVRILDTDNDGGYDKIELWSKGESPTLHTMELVEGEWNQSKHESE